MEENKIQKPFILEMDEAKMEIAQAINNAINVRNLPFYIIEMILSEFYVQIKGAANDELTMAKAQMNEQNSEEVE